MTDRRMIRAWTAALAVVVRRMPTKLRAPVLTALMETERARLAPVPDAIWPLENMRVSFDNIPNAGPQKDVMGLMVQVLVRSIVNSSSKPEAARILFGDYSGRGAGSGWLPDCLDGLPGIEVDRKACLAISESAEKKHRSQEQS